MKTHILSNQEKYISLEAHININICLFINSPQESTVEFGIVYFEVVSHVIHFLQLLNNDRDIAQPSVNIPWINQMLVCRKLNLFPLIANGWQLFTGCGEPPKNLWKQWTVCHVCEKFDSCDRFHIVAKVLTHHCQWSAANFCQPICHILTTSLTEVNFWQGSEGLSLNACLCQWQYICVERWAERVCFVWFGPRAAGDAGEDWHLQTAGGEDLWSGGLLVSVCGLEHYRNPKEPKGICTHRMWVQLCYLIVQTFWPNATL